VKSFINHPVLPIVLGGVQYFSADFINRRIIETYLWVMANYMYSCVLMVVYRFFQATGKERFLNLFESKWIMVVIIGPNIVLTPIFYFTLEGLFITSDEMKSLYKTLFPNIYTHIVNMAVIGVKVGAENSHSIMSKKSHFSRAGEIGEYRLSPAFFL
jgi:hypothetical protein